ncbi:wax ester/triacylglycerol synthase domain-containing protein [Geodermatophilus sabuli]|uniref:diacylglycerol O-acyltransferase n=1 Tax=Geodermatophilus sabuli TaxID=1564158 RepID=A0A285EDM1_9ACTN|nr:wax ester/triacylglycerol synthase domain-containing protein [Geodermatophilus sabuli]MBB3084428.1 WS/DGAT/MGAT family acyltransferase [Geodermatophilus sabuli]SNX96304.1 acyltransferase, WS/DGAT/MGAT [Geodermatophilus sabuli]
MTEPHPPGPIARAGPADLAMRAISTGGALPMQVAAVLVLGPRREAPGVGGDDLARVVAERLGGVPRLRQRLLRAPPGAGRPVWVDDPRSTAPAHVRQAAGPPPGDEQALLDLATALVAEPLPADRPTWSALVVPDLPGGRTGVVVVLSHVLADGIGGLAVLASLVDGGPPCDPSPLRPRPAWHVLAADAWRTRARAVAHWRAGAAHLRDAVRAARGLRAPRATPCSLLAPTGPHRRAAAVRVPLEPLRLAAHRAGGTVNDALLVAVAGALGALLAGRGETVDPVSVTVVVSARRSAGPADLGNATTPLVVTVPVAGDPVARLARFAGTIRAARDTATGPPVIALLGPVFRVLAAAGGYRLYLRHQRRFHTLVSNLRGPDRPLAVAGRPVEVIVPVAAGEAGNVTVSFDALSYAGTLTVTVIADAEHVPDLPVLTTALQEQLDALVSSPMRRPAAAP